MVMLTLPIMGLQVGKKIVLFATDTRFIIIDQREICELRNSKLYVNAVVKYLSDFWF